MIHGQINNLLVGCARVGNIEPFERLTAASVLRIGAVSERIAGKSIAAEGIEIIVIGRVIEWIIPLQDKCCGLAGVDFEFKELVDASRRIEVMPMAAKFIAVRGIVIEAEEVAFSGIAGRRAINLAILRDGISDAIGHVAILKVRLSIK